MAGLYLHVPFCKSRCIYCDFYSTTFGAEMRRAYVTALCREMELRSSFLGPGVPLDSIYLGGGTPSLLQPGELEQIFSCIMRLFRLRERAEVTLEANPDDLTPAYVESLRNLPVNRVSMGVQTLNDGLLRRLHRRHTSAGALKAVQCCRRSGLENLSVDLIYGLPEQTKEMWEADLDAVLALGVPHLSAYALSYEEGTPLWNMRSRGEVSEADDELSLLMFRSLMEKSAGAGYEHYEISNFARPGMQARHNSAYWTGAPYLGCGPAAHSYDGNRLRRCNSADVRAYITAAADVPHEDEILDDAALYNESVMTGLRTRLGVSVESITLRFGSHMGNYMLRMAGPHLASGRLERYGSNAGGEHIRLTAEGLFVSNDIVSDLLWVG